MKKLINSLSPHIHLFQDSKTGLAFIEDGSSNTISVHPSIHKTGSIRGMKKLGYWGKTDKVVRVGSYSYNISIEANNGSELEKIVASHCQCGGKH